MLGTLIVLASLSRSKRAKHIETVNLDLIYAALEEDTGLPVGIIKGDRHLSLMISGGSTYAELLDHLDYTY